MELKKYGLGFAVSLCLGIGLALLESLILIINKQTLGGSGPGMILVLGSMLAAVIAYIFGRVYIGRNYLDESKYEIQLHLVIDTLALFAIGYYMPTPVYTWMFL